MEFLIESGVDGALSSLRDFADVVDSTGEAWDVFGPVEPPSAVQVWIRFGLTITGCAVAGLGLGYFAASVIADRILHRR